jgi:hypothetical protein
MLGPARGESEVYTVSSYQPFGISSPSEILLQVTEVIQ